MTSNPVLQAKALLSIPDPVPENPYQKQLYRVLEARGWKLQASGPVFLRLLRRPKGHAVVHVHWLHLKRGWWLRGTRFLRFCCLLASARLLGWTLVWTVHNRRPHEAGRLDEWLHRWLERRLDAAITHEAGVAEGLAQALPRPRPVLIAAHPHYRAAYGEALPRTQARAALGLPAAEGSSAPRPLLLHFGRLRAYKGVAELLAAWDPEQADLLVAGSPDDAALAQALRERAAIEPRLHLELGHVPEERLPLLFGAADWVVLPFRAITTSGSLALALGMGRPVVLPDHPELTAVVSAPAAEFYPRLAGSVAPGGPSEAELTPLREALRRALARDAGEAAQAATDTAQAYDPEAFGNVVGAFLEELAKA